MQKKALHSPSLISELYQYALWKPVIRPSKTLCLNTLVPPIKNDEQEIFSNGTFLNWQFFIESKVGFFLPKQQTHWLWHVIQRQAAQYQTTAADLLFRAVRDERLAQRVVDAVLIPQSRFFRHPLTFDLINDIACEKIKSSPNEQQGSKAIFKTDNPLKVWSVGCAHGQETWSIAMLLTKLGFPFKLWGSDVSETALNSAIEGRYNALSLVQIPDEYHHYIKIEAQSLKIVPWLYEHTQFIKHNLFEKKPPPIPVVDIIVCQNVLIYFRQFDQRDILNRLVEQLRPDGLLLLAPGEASNWQHPLMQRYRSAKINGWIKIKNN